MIKATFIGVGNTINAASNLGGMVKGGGEDIIKLYEFTRDSTASALDKTEENNGIHPEGLLEGDGLFSTNIFGKLKNSMTTELSGLLTIQDVLDGKTIGVKKDGDSKILETGVVHDDMLNDGEDISFNLITTLKDDKNIIMKAMLTSELEGKLEDGMKVKTSYGEVFVNDDLKKNMIEQKVFSEEKYNESLQILINFKKFKEIPGFIADSVVGGVELTVSLLLDILLLKFLFAVL